MRMVEEGPFAQLHVPLQLQGGSGMIPSAKQVRRRANERGFRKLRKLWARVKGDRPARDPEYLKWLRSKRCIRPGCRCRAPYWSKDALSIALRIVEAAHTGSHGISQKASDYDAIPLCRFAHQEAKDAQGKSRTWFEDHGLDREAVIASLRAKYESERTA